jgi:hypothetical protein
METIKSPDERKWFQLLERATIALEKIAKIEAPNKPAAPVRTEAEQLEPRRKSPWSRGPARMPMARTIKD